MAWLRGYQPVLISDDHVCKVFQNVNSLRRWGLTPRFPFSCLERSTESTWLGRCGEAVSRYFDRREKRKCPFSSLKDLSFYSRLDSQGMKLRSSFLVLGR